MKVYIVIRYEGGYETTIIGVFSTRKLAEKSCSEQDVWIDEWTVVDDKTYATPTTTKDSHPCL